MKKIIIIVILIVLLGLIIYKFENQNNYGINAYTVKEPNEVGNSYSNINNDGFVAMQDDWVFYKKSSGTSSIFSKEYLMAKREGDEKVYKVAPDLHGYINVIGDWVVYTSPEFFEKVRLYKTKLDGSQRIKLSDDARVSGVQVVGNWIYYFDSVKHGIYKIALDSSKPRKIFQLSEDVSGDVDFLVDDNRIFFYYPKSGTDSSGYLYKADKDGKNQKLLLKKEIFNLNILGNWIYYTQDYDYKKIRRIKVDGTNDMPFAN